MLEFESEACVPCPFGSVYNPSTYECDWCPQEGYFHENVENYFQSTCEMCPKGLIGGYDMECVTCDSGFMYTQNARLNHCRPCNKNQICPIGTKYAFPVKKYAELLDDVKVKNVPETFNPYDDHIDRTASAVFVTWTFFSIIIIAFIAFMAISCHEKSLFIFRELDLLPITGGNRKRYVGGIVTLFYFMVITIIIAGFLVHWLFYNR